MTSEVHPAGQAGTGDGQAWWRRVLRAPGAYLTEDPPAAPTEDAHLPLAFAALVDEEDEEARRWLDAGGGAVALALQAVLMTRLGSPLAAALQREAEGAVAERAGDLEATWVALASALIRFEHGQRVRSLEALVEVGARFAAHREPIGAIYALTWAGRIELLLGHVARGRARIAAHVDAARKAGLGALAAMGLRFQEIELLPAIGTALGDPVPLGRRSLLRRERAIEGFASAAGAGDETLAEALLEAVWSDSGGPDHAVERLIVAAGRAFLERRRGAPAAMREHLRQAARQATEGGVDPGHYLRLARMVLHPQMICRGRRQFVGDGDDAANGFDILLDARRHELRARGEVVSFRRKPVVRRLFYALAAHAGRPLSKDALARAAWGSPYNPLLHEDGLRVNMQHLRRVIEPLGISVWSDDVGYHLDAPAGFAFVETVSDPIP